MNPAQNFRLPDWMQKEGFAVVQADNQRRMIVASDGLDKSGKTELAGSMPSPILYIDTDQGAEGVIDKAIARGKTVVRRLIHIPPAATTKDKDTYVKEWDKFHSGYCKALETKLFRSVVFDTADALWALLRLARFGKLEQVMPEKYAPVNAEFEEVLNAVKAYRNMNALYIHKLTKSYTKLNKEDKRESWTGGYERSGYKAMGYIAQVNIEHYRTKRDDGTLGFAMRIKNNRFAPENDGLVLEDDLISFPMLATTLFPDTTEDYWL